MKLLWAKHCIKTRNSKYYTKYFKNTRSYDFSVKAEQYIMCGKNDSENKVMNIKNKMRSPPTWEVQRALLDSSRPFLKDM